MRKLWLVFSQTVTLALACLFVLQIFFPSLIKLTSKDNPSNPAPAPLVIQQAPASDATLAVHTYSKAAQKAMPSVVNVFTSKRNVARSSHPFMDDPVFRHFFGEPSQESEPRSDNSLGSGVIVSSQGLILTNNHVIEAADQIEVALSDGRNFTATVVGTDPETDLAVLKVDTAVLPAITFAQRDKQQVGDVVLAIGNPFGVGQTVTQGIISALGRSHLGINTFENFIQTDASINPGNSGGALIDTEGNLVGINSAIYSQSGGSMGIGFAIPASLAQEVMDQIIRDGSVTRGWMGIEAQDISPQLAESFKLENTDGALIAGVLRDSPAERGGIHPGDILVAINGKSVEDSASMLTIIAGLTPQQTAKLKVVRNQQPIELNVIIGKRPRPSSPKE